MPEQIFDNIEQIGIFFAIIIATIIGAIIFNRLFGRFIRRSSLVMKTDPTNYQFLRHFLTGIIYVVGFSLAVYTLPDLRAVANSLLAGAGILAVAVGFASQHALSNIVSGIFIVIFKPFRVNDRIEIRDELLGIVEDITLRHTVIRDFKNRRIIIPNAIISDEFILNSNFEDDRICKWIEIPISYDADIDKARALMQDEGMQHPLHIDVRTPEEKAEGAPVVRVRVIAIEDSGVLLRAYVWAANASNGWVMYCDLLENMKKRFDREGIEIPYPHRSLVYKKGRTITPEEELPHDGH